MAKYLVEDTSLTAVADAIRYSEAIDPAEFNRVYTETDELIETGDEPATDLTELEQKAAAYDIITGVDE